MRYLRYADIRDMGVVRNRIGLKRLVDNEGFPKPIKLTKQQFIYRADAVEAWLSGREAQASEVVH